VIDKHILRDNISISYIHVKQIFEEEIIGISYNHVKLIFEKIIGISYNHVKLIFEEVMGISFIQVLETNSRLFQRLSPINWKRWQRNATRRTIAVPTKLAQPLPCVSETLTITTVTWFLCL